MDYKAYSTATIHFIPKNEQTPTHRYSDRSLIELFQTKSGDYFLRARDIADNKKEIFNLIIQSHDIYKFGSTPNDKDEIRCNEGTYAFYLHLAARENFHKELRQCFEQLKLKNQLSVHADSGRPYENKASTGSPDTRIIADGKRILLEVHNLSEYIQQGESDKADALVKESVKSGVQIQGKHLKERFDEQAFPIRIAIDGFDSDIQDKGKTLDMDVYPSTKIHELRAVFEYTHKFPLANQYFFVNGHLAHAESTMKDLEVKSGSLFVLFLIEKCEVNNTKF